MVQEAKEKLGDRNMTLMAEILELEKFNESKMEALSPYRQEDTPSFKYSKDKMRWHDFGGDGRSCDIIDALIQTGLTYTQAVKKLFEYAAISYDFKDIGKKKDYKYPHDENGNMQPVIDYWGKRGISVDTLEYLDITGDSQGNTVFKYYDRSDILVMVKYRLSRTANKGENKTWCQKGSDTTNILFNINRVDFSKPILVVEGEGDCMSAIEAGFYNVVSIPLGCSNGQWLDVCWDELMSCPEIIICFDNDEPGIKARKNIISRLGGAKCKYIEYPSYYEIKDRSGAVIKRMKVKDMNDLLQCSSASYILSMIANAKEVPIDTVVDLFSVEETDIHDAEGVKTGIKCIDDELVVFPFASLTLLSGRSGAGKTSLIDQIILNSIDNGYKTFLFSLEMSSGTSANWMNLIASGRRNLVVRQAQNGKKFYAASPEAKRKIADRYKNMIYSYKDDESNSVDKVFEAMEACVRRKNCRVCVIDNLMMLDLQSSEAEKNTAQTTLINRLIRFAKEYNVAIFLVCHLRKSQGGFDAAGLDEIAGSSNIGNLSMRSITLKRITDKQKKDPKFAYANYSVIASVSKDRFTGKVGSEFPLHYDMQSRRFFSDYDEFDKQYSFDTNVYTDKLPYDFIDKVNPFE